MNYFSDEWISRFFTLCALLDQLESIFHTDETINFKVTNVEFLCLCKFLDCFYRILFLDISQIDQFDLECAHSVQYWTAAFSAIFSTIHSG